MSPTVPLSPFLFGLDLESIKSLGQDLLTYHGAYHEHWRVGNRDSSDYAYHYLSGLLRMTTGRNFTQIARSAGMSDHNLHHFMSNSNWDAHGVIRQVQQEIGSHEVFASGGALLLDESAEERSGYHSVGCAKQYNGRLGKVEISQMGVFLAYVHRTVAPVWTWVDAELYLPEHWFAEDYTDLRKAVKVPEDRGFATKVELGLRMIERAHTHGLPFDIIACDDLYGRSQAFRTQLREAGHWYMADVPATTRVFLENPETTPQKRAYPVSELVQRQLLDFKKVKVRHTERGLLKETFAARRIWVVESGQAVEQWIVVRKEGKNKHSYSLCNAPQTIPLPKLAGWKCQRYFVERANQEAKSELGFGEFEAHSFNAWQHHCALSIMAAWFIAQTKLKWTLKRDQHPDAPKPLVPHELPQLSVANVRELLRAVMPLPQLTPEMAMQQIEEKLIRRHRSIQSRIKNNSS